MIINDKQPSKTVIARARKLKVAPLSPTKAKVWGGQGEHIVTMIGDSITCDCSCHYYQSTGDPMPDSPICSHMWAVLQLAKAV